MNKNEILEKVTRLLDSKVNEVFAEMQEDLSIQSGDVEPEAALLLGDELDRASAMITGVLWRELGKSPFDDTVEFTRCEGRENWDYILANWDGYGLECIKERDDMLELLYVLECVGETLDTLHDVGTMGNRTQFGPFIFADGETDSDIASTLLCNMSTSPASDVATEVHEFLDMELEEQDETAPLTPEILEEIRGDFLFDFERLHQREAADMIVTDYFC